MAFIVDDLQVGGSEIFLRDLIFALQGDQEITPIALFAGGPVADELAEAGIPVRVLGLRKWNAPWKLFELISILTDRGIEVLHCERLVSSIFGVVAGRLARVPKIYVRRGSLPWWPGPWVRRLDRITMAWSDGVITASEAIRDGYVEEHRLPVEKFRVIPHGLPPSVLGAAPRPGEDDDISTGHTVGCVANFNWRKDHETLFHAFRAVALEFPDALLHLVGTGPLEPDLRERVARSSVRDQVEFLGPRYDVEEILRGFDVLVLPSRTEGFGRVLIEAMAAGVPVIATAVGGIPEVVTNDLTGLLVRPESPEAMAGALLHLFREPREARRLAGNARRDVASRFSLEMVVAMYRDLIGIPAEPEEGGDRALEETPCPLCAGDGRTPVTRRPDGMLVVRCRACGLLFVSPRPTGEALASIYTQEYFEGRGEYGWMQGYLETETAELERPDNYWSGILRRLDVRLGRKGKVLDVGCSGGFFLEQARREAWEGHGVEVSEAMVEFARERFGHERIHHGDLKSAGFPDAEFDAVLLHNLIEHVADPAGTMREVHRILRPGGVACLTTPNAKAVGVRGGEWSGFGAHFGHVTFFTRKTLDRLLREAGLAPVRWEYQDLNLSFAATRCAAKVMAGSRTPAGVRKTLSAARSAWQGVNSALFRAVHVLGYSRNLLVIATRGPGAAPPPAGEGR